MSKLVEGSAGHGPIFRIFVESCGGARVCSLYSNQRPLAPLAGMTFFSLAHWMLRIFAWCP